jgi:hypothetical protein
MKKAEREPRLLPAHPFTKAVRGKYVKRLARGSNVVLLDPDVSAAFPTSAAVNKALRKQINAPKALSLKARGPNKATQKAMAAARRGRTRSLRSVTQLFDQR